MDEQEYIKYIRDKLWLTPLGEVKKLIEGEVEAGNIVDFALLPNKNQARVKLAPTNDFITLEIKVG